jgi:hypothetical protein
MSSQSQPLTATADAATPASAPSVHDGDLWWVAGDGESGFGNAADAFEAATDYQGCPEYPVALSRAQSLPDVWAAYIVTKREEDGEPIDGDVQLFATEAEAMAAISNAKGDS